MDIYFHKKTNKKKKKQRNYTEERLIELLWTRI